MWDTVGSLGDDSILGWGFRNISVPFSTNYRVMDIGRQALAIDERRSLFAMNLWGAPYSHQDIKQVWFAGAHADIGGGYPEEESGLSKFPLDWMLTEAISAGLLVDHDRKALILGLPDNSPFARADSTAPLHDELKGKWSPFWWVLELRPTLPPAIAGIYIRHSYRIPLGSPRFIPQSGKIHESVGERMEKLAEYRPRNLPSVARHM